MSRTPSSPEGRHMRTRSAIASGALPQQRSRRAVRGPLGWPACESLHILLFRAPGAPPASTMTPSGPRRLLGSRPLSLQLRIGDVSVHVADEFPELGVLGPRSIGGTPVVLSLE